MAKSRTSGAKASGARLAKTDSLKNWFDSKSQTVIFYRRKKQITVIKRSDGKFDITDTTGKKLEKRAREVVFHLLEGTIRENGKVKII